VLVLVDVSQVMMADVGCSLGQRPAPFVGNGNRKPSLGIGKRLAIDGGMARVAEPLLVSRKRHDVLSRKICVGAMWVWFDEVECLSEFQRVLAEDCGHMWVMEIKE
jgi:hypothetical protein